MRRVVQVRTPEASAYYGVPVGGSIDLDSVFSDSGKPILLDLPGPNPPIEDLKHYADSSIRRIRESARLLGEYERDLRWALAAIAERELEENP